MKIRIKMLQRLMVGLSLSQPMTPWTSRVLMTKTLLLLALHLQPKVLHLQPQVLFISVLGDPIYPALFCEYVWKRSIHQKNIIS